MQKDQIYWENVGEIPMASGEMSKLLDNNFSGSCNRVTMRKSDNKSSHRWMRIKNRFIIFTARQNRNQSWISWFSFRLSTLHFCIFFCCWASVHSIEKLKIKTEHLLDIFHVSDWLTVRLLNGEKNEEKRKSWKIIFFCFQVYDSSLSHFNCMYANDEVS